MGYPFDKSWERRRNSTTPVREIVKDLPHILISDFTIYRSTKLYQGYEHHPSHKITWDNTIKDFFTVRVIRCMKVNGDFDLGNRQSVKANVGQIYAAVKSRTMPKGDAAWSVTRVATFKEWMDSGCP